MSNERWLTKDGKTQSLAEWARQLGISDRTIRDRLSRGMTEEEALSGRKKAYGWSVTTQLKNKRTEGCCLPDCQNCPLPECNYNGMPTREETKMVKEALAKLPDTPAAYSHVYRNPRVKSRR